jgi:hypothetical protein
VQLDDDVRVVAVALGGSTEVDGWESGNGNPSVVVQRLAGLPAASAKWAGAVACADSRDAPTAGTEAASEPLSYLELSERY